jgi:hypothetical protein
MNRNAAEGGQWLFLKNIGYLRQPYIIWELLYKDNKILCYINYIGVLNFISCYDFFCSSFLQILFYKTGQ